jgi:hypothetical protein
MNFKRFVLYELKDEEQLKKNSENLSLAFHFKYIFTIIIGHANK